MSENPSLIYEGKESERDILREAREASLKEIRTYGGQKKILKQWRNMLIHGDCLPILKALSRKLDEKPRLVYIDPPFSTSRNFRGSSAISSSREDSIAYKDKVVGANFLEFLRRRLILLRRIMADNASIYVHIDWRKGHYIKVLMDEIFGERNFINDIARIRCNPKNLSNPAYGKQKDMILFYSKTNNYIWNNPRIEMTDKEIERLYHKIDKDGRRYMTTPLHAPGETKRGSTGQAWRGLRPPKGRSWRYSPRKLTELEKKGLIEWSSTGNPRKIKYASETEHSKKMQDVWEFKDPQYSNYPTEKNLNMLRKIVETSSDSGDIVLDSFSGSGTTLVASEESGRRWIGIDNSKVAIRKSIDRLSNLKERVPFTVYAEEGVGSVSKKPRVIVNGLKRKNLRKKWKKNVFFRKL